MNFFDFRQSEMVCEVDIHLSINVSSDSSVSVTPKIQCRKQSFAEKPERKLSRKRKRAYSDPGPKKARKDSSTEV